MKFAIEQISLQSLDWPELLSVIAGHCTHTSSAAWVKSDPRASERGEILRRYSIVSELMTFNAEENSVPLQRMIDPRLLLDQARHGEPLNRRELCTIRDSLEGMHTIRDWGYINCAENSELRNVVEQISIDPLLLSTLRQAFDEQGRFSARTYPQLALLVQRQMELRDSIQSELERLLADEHIGKHLQEPYFTERNGRLVLPLKPNYPRRFGVVQALSRSGETVFVEPMTVLERSNALRETELAIEHREREICRQLTLQVSAAQDWMSSIFRSLMHIDLLLAGAKLAVKWSAVVPDVQECGKIEVRKFRHPLLIESGAVANDFCLDESSPVLILSGPNAGGKTIALKSFGMLALMTQLGVPLPAAPGARVDFFGQVVADIGDAQTVEGLSTFSGHLLRIKAFLSSSPSSHRLVLLDEIGMGTDPAQGAALAQAVVEQLVEQNCRVALTTHFTRLKALAAVDQRFKVAAMRFESGHPTFRMELGSVGESHALSLAKRLELPHQVISRAEALLSDSESSLSELITQLEAERAQLDIDRSQINQREIQLERRALELAQRAADLTAEKEVRIQQIASSYRQSLERKETQLRRMIARLKSNDKVERTALESELALLPSSEQLLPKKQRPSLGEHIVNVGDRLKVVALNVTGTVTKIQGQQRFILDINGMEMAVDRSDVSFGGRRLPAETEVQHIVELVEQEPLTVRTEHNTCDLRGCRVQESLHRLEAEIDAIKYAGSGVIFVLHGHGTGALKRAIREWLPVQTIRSWRPAEHSEGGDAFTVVFV